MTKKIIALASAALIFSACEDSTSASSVNLGTKFLSARNVTVDETNQTIDMALPLCKSNSGKAVLSEIASGPSPYTISNGKLNIANSSFEVSGNNSSIIGVWNVDINKMMGSSSGSFDFEDMGFKMYLDIGKKNFDVYVNSDNACMAKVFADEMLGDPDAEEMNMKIVSQECNKIVISMEGQKVTITTEPKFPNITMSISIFSFTCDMKVGIEQASEKNCTDENISNGNFDENGMYLQTLEYSEGCNIFGMEKATRLAKKVMTKRR